MTTQEVEATGGFAIVGDLHGRVDLLQRALELIDPSLVQFVVQDILNKGPEVRETLLLARDIGAVGLADNHSWVTANALNYPEHGEILWLRDWHRRYESKTLESFGITKTSNARIDAMRLREKFFEDDVNNLIFGTVPYLEPPDEDFIAVHAGITAEPWEDQRKDLDEAEPVDVRQNFAPIQIFDDRDHSLSLSTRVLPSATAKTLITGHAHNPIPVDERITDKGRRVRIASGLNRGEPLFVYLTMTKQLVVIEQ